MLLTSIVEYLGIDIIDFFLSKFAQPSKCADHSEVTHLIRSINSAVFIVLHRM